MGDFFLESGGYLGIIIFLVLTGCGLPVPEEVPIVLAGILSSQDKLIPEWAFLSCLVGAFLGDWAMYGIGYHFGHGLVAKHPRYGKFVGAQREEYFEQAIQKHGFKVMLLARFMVGIRGPVYLATGVVRMPFRRFLLYDLVCATIVVTTFFGLSYFYGREITEYIRDAERTLTLIVLAVIGFAFLWWMRRRRQRMLDEAIEKQHQQQWTDRASLSSTHPATDEPAESSTPQEKSA